MPRYEGMGSRVLPGELRQVLLSIITPSLDINLGLSVVKAGFNGRIL